MCPLALTWMQTACGSVPEGKKGKTEMEQPLQPEDEAQQQVGGRAGGWIGGWMGGQAGRQAGKA